MKFDLARLLISPCLLVMLSQAGTTFCGNCIDLGYRYCNNQGRTASTDFRALTSESVKSSNVAKCCTSDVDTCYSDWMRKDDGTHTICSAPYNNTLYAKFQCPFDNSCGDQYLFELNDIGDTLQFDIKPPAYSSCFFIIKTYCGILAIDSSDFSTKHKYEHISFEKGHLYTGQYSDQDQSGPPADDMPARSETFVYDDDRNVWQGMIQADESFFYFGSDVQGSKSKVNGSKCKERTTYFIVTATSATETVTVALEAVSFTKGSNGLLLASSIIAAAFASLFFQLF